jgi:POLO box duplicated region
MIYCALIIDRVPERVPTFVTRWVDHTGKYGLAFNLSNSVSGMYFKDRTSIILSPVHESYDYFGFSGECTPGTIGKHPADLEKKLKLAIKYKGYMNDKLHGIEVTPSSPSESTEKAFVAEFRRAANAVFFRMSDDVFQVPPLICLSNEINFPDHSKVVLWDGGKAVRYVNKTGEIQVWSLAAAVVKGKGEVIDRLKIVSKELVSWAELIAKDG